MMQKSPKSAAFTLIEVAIVLVIGGLLIAALSGYLVNFMRTTKIKTTQARMEQIKDAIQLYSNTNNRFPCAAAMNLSIDDANFGREIAGCTGAVAGTWQPVGARGGYGNVRIGAIPTRDLNLPDEYSQDAWGSRFYYAVTERLTNSATFNKNDGAIAVIDSNNNTVVVPAATATFIIISVGSDRKGGYTSGGVQTEACGGTELDIENCNNDATFRQTIQVSDTSNNFHFDDYVLYSGRVTAGGDELTNILRCQAKKKFYVPSSTYADSEGCDGKRYGTTRTVPIIYPSTTGGIAPPYFDMGGETAPSDGTVTANVNCDGGGEGRIRIDSVIQRPNGSWQRMGFATAQKTTPVSSEIDIASLNMEVSEGARWKIRTSSYTSNCFLNLHFTPYE